VVTGINLDYTKNVISADVLSFFRRRYMNSSICILFIPVFTICSSIFAQVEYGIAAQYQNDIGISEHSDVVFTEDFEEETIAAMQSRWSDEGEVQRGEYMKFSDDVPSLSGGTKSMTGPGNEEGPGLYRRLIGDDTGYDKLYFRFYSKLDNACESIHHYSWMGGHNPSTSWPNPRAGYRPAGDSHFSSGAEPGEEGWDFYTYWKDMGCWGSENGECHGNCFLWGNPKPEVVKGEWFCWEMMITLNDPPESNNGEQAFWINGVKYAHYGPGFPEYAYTGTDRWGPDPEGEPWPGFQWRTDAALKINYVWLYNYVHDDACRVWFDDVVVATSYIGPMVDEAHSVRKSPSSRQQYAPLDVYPVQNGNNIVLHLQISADQPVNIVISSAIGRKMASFSAVADKSILLNKSNFSPGVYLVKVECDEKMFFSRFAVM
jgi:hypothetical protein